MATLFSCQFPSMKGGTFTVYVDDEDFGGSATVVDCAGDGFTLSYDGTEEVEAAIIGSQLQFTIAVLSGVESAVEAFAADLITSAEGRFTIKVLRNGGLYWCGYVLPDLSGFDDIFPPYGFRVTAVDGLARLKSEPYNDGNTPAEPVGVETFKTHILNCLTTGTLHTKYYTTGVVFLKTAVNWTDATIGAPTATKCPLAYTRVSGEIFAKRPDGNDAEEWQFMSKHDVLTTILRNWQCRILFSGGTYRVEQIPERSFDTHYERGFDYAGTLVTSTASASNDVQVEQGTINEKLRGNNYNYLSALKSVNATWPHRTVKNQLAGVGGKWIGGSAQTASVEIKNVTTDADTRFVIRAGVSFLIDLGGSYTVPWRYVIGMQVVKDGQYLKSNTFSVVNGQGDPLQQVGRDPLTWTATPSFYEISTPFSVLDKINHIENINIEVGNIPTTGSTITVSFVLIGAEDIDEDPMLGPVVLNWGVKAPQLYIVSSDDADSYIEQERQYDIENPLVGNSDFLEFEMAFGSAVQGWTQSKLQTSSNGSTWTDSGLTWDRGTNTDNLEYGQLWAQQAMALRKFPLRTYRGQIFARDLQAHSRAVFMADDTAWLMLRGSYTARTNIWDGSWVQAGINEVDVAPLPPKKKQRLFVFLPGFLPGEIGLPEFTSPPSSFSQASTGIGATVAEASLTALIANFVGSTIPAGTVTNVPVRHSIPAGAFLAGDNIFLFNPSTGRIDPVTVATTSQNGDTSIAINSASLPADVPSGSIILYSVMNKASQTGGVPSALLPEGTVAGQILRWNESSEVWEPYSGNTDGYVLTWDSVNGWQAEPPGSGPQGPQGATGAQGTQGVQGATGAQGNQGTQGATGSTGSQGPQGETGSQGPQGFQGTQGNQGFQGTQGNQGFQGTQGNQGFQGTQGVQGAQGAQGSGGLTGSGVANRIAIWTSASNLSSDDSPLWFDGANNRLGVNTSTPAATIHAGVPTGTDNEGLRVLGSLSGNLNNTISNANAASATANAILNIVTGGTAAGDPILQFSVSGGTTLSAGLDNSDSDKFKLKYASTPSSAPSNTGITVTNNSPHRVGINNDAPAYDLDVANTARARTLINTNVVPTVTPGTGMGTSPSGISVLGTQNGLLYSFTTGSSPTLNGTIFTVQPQTAYPTFMFPVFCAANAQTATDITKFRIGSSGNTSFTITANGTLSASTAYSLYIHILGY